MPVKGEVGEWMLGAFKWLNRLRFLKSTPLDPFRNTAEARMGREALVNYEDDLEFALAHADGDPALLLELLDLPRQIRGYGHVREAAMVKVDLRREQLRAQISAPQRMAAQ
jgi:indolepyruvate ferredoxin oxidoreductase